VVWANKDSTTLGTTNRLDDIAYNRVWTTRWVIDLSIRTKRKEEAMLGVCIVKNQGWRKEETENEERKHAEGPEEEEDNSKE
jgi:hypothetical protein